MIREAKYVEAGISVGDRIIINTIRYADDKSVVANSQKGLQQLMDNLNKVTKEFVCISRKGNNKMKIYVDGQQVEQERQFRYLGNLISEDGYFTKEIRSRIGMAKKVFMEQRK